jgi:hypothetical protein
VKLRRHRFQPGQQVQVVEVVRRLAVLFLVLRRPFRGEGRNRQRRARDLRGPLGVLQAPADVAQQHKPRLRVALAHKLGDLGQVASGQRRDNRPFRRLMAR